MCFPSLLNGPKNQYVVSRGAWVLKSKPNFTSCYDQGREWVQWAWGQRLTPPPPTYIFFGINVWDYLLFRETRSWIMYNILECYCKKISFLLLESVDLYVWTTSYCHLTFLTFSLNRKWYFPQTDKENSIINTGHEYWIAQGTSIYPGIAHAIRKETVKKTSQNGDNTRNDLTPPLPLQERQTIFYESEHFDFEV